MAKTLQLWPAVFIYSPGALQPSFLSLNKTAEGKAAEKIEERDSAFAILFFLYEKINKNKNESIKYKAFAQQD